MPAPPKRSREPSGIPVEFKPQIYVADAPADPHVHQHRFQIIREATEYRPELGQVKVYEGIDLETGERRSFTPEQLETMLKPE